MTWRIPPQLILGDQKRNNFTFHRLSYSQWSLLRYSLTRANKLGKIILATTLFIW